MSSVPLPSVGLAPLLHRLPIVEVVVVIVAAFAAPPRLALVQRILVENEIFHHLLK